MNALAIRFEQRLGNSVGLIATIAIHLVVLLLLLSSRVQPEAQPAPLMAHIISDGHEVEPQPEPLRVQPTLARPQLYVPQPEVTLTDTAPAASAPAAVAAAAPSAASTEAKSAPNSVPVFDADYLNNPAPAYPRVSRRLREQGVVMVRVFVLPDGAPQTVELKESSGFPRLDESALDAVRNWKFVPAMNSGRAIGAWVIVPVAFSLNA